jgi:predicted RNase H-like HicB family nuclease
VLCCSISASRCRWPVQSVARLSEWNLRYLLPFRGRHPEEMWQNRLMKRPFSATVWREGDWFVSQCLDLDIASQGSTEEEALANLREALELHFEPPVASHPPAVRQIEVEVGAA